MFSNDIYFFRSVSFGLFFYCNSATKTENLFYIVVLSQTLNCCEKEYLLKRTCFRVAANATTLHKVNMLNNELQIIALLALQVCLRKVVKTLFFILEKYVSQIKLLVIVDNVCVCMYVSPRTWLFVFCGI